MRFVEHKGLIFIPVTLGYDNSVCQISDCILDTGSAGTVIDTGLIPFNHKIPGVLKRLHGIGGHQDVVSQYADFIQIGNCRQDRNG